MRESTERVSAPRGVRDSDRAFLEALLSSGRMSRAEVAKVADMSKPTASEAANRLLRAGIINPVGQAQGRRGRAPQLYEINPTFGTGLSVVARGDQLDISVVDFTGEPLDQDRVSLDPRLSPEGLAKVLHERTRSLVSSCPAPCRGTAVSLAAPVDPRTGQPVRLREPPFPAADVDVISILQPLTHGLVVVDNDVNWTALAACADVALPTDGVVLHVHLGAGLGAALTVEGSLVQGRRGAFGEIGRFRGKGDSITHRLGALGALGEGGYFIDTDFCRRMITENSPQAKALKRVLAEALSNAIVMIDPDHVVVSGPLVENTDALDRLLPFIAHALDDSVMPQVSISPWGERAPIVGTRAAAQDLLRDSAGKILSTF